MRRRSRPNHFHIVRGKLPIGRQERKTLDLSLRGQQPIKGIPVMRWQIARPKRVLMRDRESTRAGLVHATGDVVRRVRGKNELPARVLDGDFPGAGRREQQLRLGMLDECTGRVREPLRRQIPLTLNGLLVLTD
jgi:hypothetical protein